MLPAPARQSLDRASPACPLARTASGKAPYCCMSKESNSEIAAAEAAAQRKESAEEAAHERFHAVRAQMEAHGRRDAAVETDEFKQWMQSRRETDEAWGQWAMAMDAKGER
jgi:hypothetical protein